MKKVVMGRFAAVILVVGFLFVGIATAQQPQQFEVATIKPSDPKLLGSRSDWTPGGHYRILNEPLKEWLEEGFAVSDYALKAPAWLDTARFDLDAVIPTDKPLNERSRSEMMKALLVERFGLKWHEEVQLLSGFELVQDKKVLLAPAGTLEQLRGGGSAWGPSGGQITNGSMTFLAELLGRVLGKPVVDRTNLPGVYSIDLNWRSTDEAELARERQDAKHYGYADPDSLPGSASDALREKCGLRLQSTKVPVKVIVVDSINHLPTPN